MDWMSFKDEIISDIQKSISEELTQVDYEKFIKDDPEEPEDDDDDEEDEEEEEKEKVEKQSLVSFLGIEESSKPNTEVLVNTNVEPKVINIQYIISDQVNYHE